MLMITMKHEDLGARVDLKEFFEASIGALQEDKEALKTGDQANRRNRPLVQRVPVNATSANRAVTDAARALAAMWRLQTSARNGATG
jgi:hypothetical protein